LQERETIRLLLNYADKHVEEHLLSDFILQELDDVVFTNDIYRQIFEEFRSGVKSGTVPDSQHFITHGNSAIKNAVAELITTRYDTSKHWSDKYKIYFPRETDVLNELALSNVLRLKFRFVQGLMEDNLQKIKSAEQIGNLDELEEALKTQTGLKDAERELARLLGIVVAK
jgi:DNA primase